MADIETEQFGRYLIKSGPLSSTWGANAFRGKTLVAKATGATRDEAVAVAKAQLTRLDEVDLSERDAEGAPSATRYEAAFQVLLPELPASYVAMLRAH